MALRSVADPEFLAASRAALAARGELLVLQRVAYAAGLKVWALVRSPEAFDGLIAQALGRASFTVYLRDELPLRGAVDEGLVANAVALLQQRGELLLLELDAEGDVASERSSDELAEIDEWLRERTGRRVAIGAFPPFWLPDDDRTITGYVPDADGVVRPGAY